MEPKWESVFNKARQETLSAFGTIYFWIFDLLLAAFLTVFVLRWQPSWAKEGNAMICYQVLVPVAGAILGLAIVFLIALFCAPYKITEKAKPKIKVEKIEFRPLKWVLKIINESDETAENCIGILEMVEDVEPSAYPSSDMHGSRHLMWEDTNSIPSQGSALLCVIDIRLSTNKDGRPEAIPAYEKPDVYPLALNQYLILLISLRSDGCRPLYTICYCYRDNLKNVHQLKVIASNLGKRPTVDDCRRILTEHIAGKLSVD